MSQLKSHGSAKVRGSSSAGLERSLETRFGVKNFLSSRAGTREGKFSGIFLQFHFESQSMSFSDPRQIKSLRKLSH